MPHNDELTEEQFHQIRRREAVIPKEFAAAVEEKNLLAQEIFRLRQRICRLEREKAQRESDLQPAPDVRSERDVERASSAGVDFVQLAAELNCGRQPVLWLFRAGSGPVYASRQKPEPQVLTGVLAWTVDGQLCPVSLPLRDWIEPGQRMALVAAPIGGDA